jgi:predicted dehydrogenase
MKPIRTAIFGTGFMGRVHLEAVRRLEFVEASAIAGRNQDAAQRLGTGFAIPAIATDYRDVLRDPTIDVVHICTPNAQHFPMAKDALGAGKHVICEKPLATTVEQGEELVALAAQQGVRNCVCHNLRFYPMVQQMRRMREAPGHVFSGLAALRHRLELARRFPGRWPFALYGRHRLALV